MKWLLIVVAIGLTACVSPEARLARDTAECQTLGFQPNTPEMGDCILELRQWRTARSNAAATRANASANTFRSIYCATARC